MSGMIVWLGITYAMLIGVGAALFAEGVVVPGLVLILGVPAARIALHFRRGYRLIGDLSKFGGTLSDVGGVATRDETPRWFKVCVIVELAVVLTLYGLYFVVPLVR